VTGAAWFTPSFIQEDVLKRTVGKPPIPEATRVGEPLLTVALVLPPYRSRHSFTVEPDSVMVSEAPASSHNARPESTPPGGGGRTVTVTV